MAEKSPPFVLVVPAEARGARLDRFLSVALGSTSMPPSRSTLQRWIERGRVRVDGVPKKAAERLRQGARVEVHPEPAPLSEAKPDPGIVFPILFQDDHVVVLDKPPGLVVHPARGHEAGTLVNGLLALGLFRSQVADPRDREGHLRPGIVHRLDKGTSGIMIVARTESAREKLKAQFSAHTIEREYEAICVGKVTARTFDTLHGRHPTDRLRFTTKVKQGKRAVTEVRVIEELAHGRASHVTCRLRTGRTHQIRVHLSEASTPILGDPIYGSLPRDGVLRRAAQLLGHQALHARVLGFEHPTTKKRMRFETEPPRDFQLVLNQLLSMP